MKTIRSFGRRKEGECPNSEAFGMRTRHRFLFVWLLVTSWIVLAGCQSVGPMLDRAVGPKKGIHVCAPRPQYKGDLPTTHTVKAKETLWGMAHYYYGDGKQWGRIAKANGIANARLRTGTSLTIPQ